jgi:hypothetical protein
LVGAVVSEVGVGFAGSAAGAENSADLLEGGELVAVDDDDESDARDLSVKLRFEVGADEDAD